MTESMADADTQTGKQAEEARTAATIIDFNIVDPHNNMTHNNISSVEEKIKFPRLAFVYALTFTFI